MEREGRRFQVAGRVTVIALMVALTLVFSAGVAGAEEKVWSDVCGVEVSVNVSDLAWDEVGQRLFVATDKGVQRYDPALGTWSSVGLEGFSISSLILEGDSLWAWAYSRGLCRYSLDDGTWDDLGMGPSRCWELASDGSGIYVAASDEGLWRFDTLAGAWSKVGEDEIPGYVVTCLAWDGSGLYVGTDFHGCLYYRPGEGTWTGLGGELDNPYYGIDSLLLHDGYLYVGSSLGLWVYDTQKKEWSRTTLYSSDINEMVCGGPCLYVATWYDGVIRFDPATGEAQNTWGGAINTYFTSLAWDGTRLYAGTQGKCVWRYVPQEGSWIRLGWAIKSARARGMAWDGASLYAGEYDGGIWAGDPQSRTWRDISLEEGPRGASVMLWGAGCLYVASGKELWSYAPGDRSWKMLGKVGDQESILSLAFSGSEVYAGTDGGCIWRYDRGTGEWENVFSHWFPIMVCALAWDGSGLCAGYNYLGSVMADWGGGVLRYDPRANIAYDLIAPSINDEISSLAWDGANLYVGREKTGLWKYAPTRGELQNVSGNAGLSLSVRSLFWSGSALFMGTESKGVWSYDPVSGNFTDTGGWISGYSVYSLAGDSSNLFAWANGHGIWRYGPKAAPAIDSVFPGQGTQLDLWLSLTVQGRGFETGAQVRLCKGSVVINALLVNVTSETRLTAVFSLFGAEPGVYDLVLVNPDGKEARLAQCFEVNGICGAGAGTALLPLGIALGLLSGGAMWRRRWKRRG